MKRIFGLLILLTVLCQSSWAQSRDISQSQANYAAFYSYYEPGDLTIRVSAWGAVRFPGLYEIPRGTSLQSLFSLSGGPQFGERERRSKRNMTIELFRTVDGERQMIFRQEMENDITAIDSNPVLSDGDILSVQAVTRRTFSVRDIFPILSAALTTVILIDNLQN
jgi:hypothetical protein